MLLLLKNLESHTYEKHLVCLSGYGLLETEARRYCHRLYDLDYPRVREKGKLQWRRIPYLFAPVPRLTKLLREIQPDILHTLIPVCNVMGAIAARMAGFRNLIASRLSLGNYRDKNRFLAVLENFTDPQFRIIHCKSNGIAQDVLRREPVKESQIRIVYNGLDTAHYKSVSAESRRQARERLDLSDSAKVIGMVANLWKYKGHLDVVRALPEVLQLIPDAIAVFIGRDDGMASALLHEARTLGVVERMLLIGERDDVHQLLPAFDVLVSASHEEGFSNVILEAMATGLPVIATNVGGNPEQVTHKRTGLLVPPDSPAAMAEALQALLSDQAIATAWGEAGRQRVEDNFSVSAMVSGMKSIYHEMVNSTD